MSIGSSRPEMVLLETDEFLHPIEDASNFNESAYYNFFNHNSQILGGWLRIGNRPNEGYAEVTVVIYEPDGTVGFNFKRPEISGNKSHEAGGAKFEVITPWKEHHVTYSGTVCVLTDPLELRDPSRAFKTNPFAPVSIDLRWFGISPGWGGEPRRKGNDGKYVSVGKDDPDHQFARGHFEQIGTAKGEVVVGERRYVIDGRGLRDHSWGPRYWQNTPHYQWLTMNFGEEMGMMGNRVEVEGGPRYSGFVWEKGKPIRNVSRVEVETEYAGPDQIHDRIRAQIYPEGSDKAIEVTGKVLSPAPCRNRRAGWITRITEAMTEWKMGSKTGYGVSEYLVHLQRGE